ncbi:hypothetical protein A4A49_10079 [Nicotiana attenuata]|uniref:Uncharacterized protein n=1 Tax=Nicotiana attenuata TaxID=49451 RepID=A0A314LI76_NICAT|nr:hypothetical protein A4A49_10079 [Nicotiana attenuata]
MISQTIPTALSSGIFCMVWPVLGLLFYIGRFARKRSFESSMQYAFSFSFFLSSFYASAGAFNAAGDYNQRLKRGCDDFVNSSRPF